MSSSTTTQPRPRTSKPRGTCKYYTTPRGCFAGSSCKFLHAEPDHQDTPSSPLLTPYDEAKRCRYYGNGFCRRGDQCWFKHIADDSSSNSHNPIVTDEDAQNEPCSICFEKPVTYGLLSGCSHIFCIVCIRQWRDQKGPAEHGNTKKCPMCRESSKFITPSSRFWKQGHPEKEKVVNAYKESMARVPCRYFTKSLQNDKVKPLCPFGKDCFYQHLNDDGSPYIFKNGANVCMRQYYQQRGRLPSNLIFDDLIDFDTDFIPFNLGIGHGGASIFSMQITADIGTLPEQSTMNQNPSEHTNNNIEASRIRQQFGMFRDAMENLGNFPRSNESVTRALELVRMLIQRNTTTESGEVNPEDADPQPPSTDYQERSGLWFRNGEYSDEDGEEDGMPDLQSISNSSISEGSISDLSDSELPDDVIRLDAGVWEPELGEESVNEEEVRAMQEISEQGPEEVLEEVGMHDAEIDEAQLPVMDYELEDESRRVANPPFLTDGRGRVVWSSESEEYSTKQSS